MANINQIQVGSTVYDIEDQVARSDIASLATVATSGDYGDLSNTPAALSAFTDDLGSSPTHTHSQYLTSETEPAFTASAAYGITSTDITNWNNKSDFSGDYDDLTDKPVIPSKTSDLTNDSGFITSYVRPACSAFMDEITAVKTYPENNGRIIEVNKNHITVTRTASGTTFALMSLIGSGTNVQYSNISSAKVKALYDAGEFLPRDHYLYNLPDANKKWYLNVSFFRPAGSGEGAAIYLIAYDTVNETYRNLASMSISSSFVPNEAAGSYLADFSTLTENEVIMVLFYRRSGNAPYRGVAMEWDWSLESARGIFEDQNRQDSNLAWVEGTTTASRAYAVGDYVTIQGVLCKITAAVANGGTLTSGTNYTAIGGNGGLANNLEGISEIYKYHRAIPSSSIKQWYIHTTASPQSFILIGYRAEFAVFEIRSGALAVNKLGNTINYTIPEGSTNTISVYTNSNYTRCDIYSISPFTVNNTL